MLVRTKRLKKYTKALIISAAAFLWHANLSAQNVWVKEHEPAREHISYDKLERELSFLTDSLCQGRATGTRGGAEAAFWIHRRFSNAGLLKFGDSYGKKIYVSKDVIGHNIMGMIPGSPRHHRDSYIIIGAHFDHLGILNGNKIGRAHV